MQPNPEMLKRLEDIKEREVAISVSTLDHSVKVSDRLMIVKDDAQSDWILHFVWIVGIVAIKRVVLTSFLNRAL
jgi:hypothetical protein